MTNILLSKMDLQLSGVLVFAFATCRQWAPPSYHEDAWSWDLVGSNDCIRLAFGKNNFLIKNTGGGKPVKPFLLIFF